MKEKQAQGGSGAALPSLKELYNIIVDRQKSETYPTQKAAEKRKKEIEYKMSVGEFEAPKCILLKELLSEYIKIYGHDKWSVSTYDGNVGIINNYIIPTIGDTKISAINNHSQELFPAGSKVGIDGKESGNRCNSS